MQKVKDKYRVSISCHDGSLVKGTIHVYEGLRVLDFLNLGNDAFIIVTDAEISASREPRSFQLYADFKEKKDIIMLNKKAIKWLEEIKKI